MPQPLDLAWERIDALRQAVTENLSVEQTAMRDCFNAGIACALKVIEELGGMDPAMREAASEEDPAMRVRGGSEP